MSSTDKVVVTITAAPTSPDTTSATDATAATDNQTGSATLSQMFATADSLDVGLMIVGTLGGVITGVSIPFFEVLFGQMLDAINTDPSSFSRQILQISYAFIVVAGANLITGFVQVHLWTIAGERQAQKFRALYVKSVLSQEIGWFDNIGANELSTRLTILTGSVQDGMGRKVGDLIQYISQFVASFFVGLYYSWRLTVVLLASIPLIGLAGALMISGVTATTNGALEQYAKAGGLATESLNTIRTVTALNAQPDIISKYRLHLYEAMKIGIKKSLRLGLGQGSFFASAFFTFALGFWYGSKLLSDQIMHGCGGSNACVTGGEVSAVFFSVLMGSIALGQMSPALSSFTAARSAVYSMNQIINRKPLIDGFADVGDKPSEKTKGSITLSNVEFAYPTRPNIIVCKDYNLSIQPGETVALVGVSGCGKSTIINLLLRFYDPQAGTVCIDGRDITTLNVKWLRAQIGLVSQEPILFSGSIADNISYGLDLDLVKLDDGVSVEEYVRSSVIAAAKLANAHEFITGFPQGYDTDVGSNGTSMSGGQKQRIAIARALIKKPAILLLDEATSALDATSEKVVQQSIDSLSASKAQTTLIIAHRLSTIRNADKICVISEGVIAEIGTHDQLIGKNGLYADLVRLQMSSDNDSSNDDGNIVAAVAAGVGSTDEMTSKTSDTGTCDTKATVAAAAIAEDVVLQQEQIDKVSTKIWDYVYEHKWWLLLGISGSAVFGAIFPVWGLMLAKTQNMFYLTDPYEIRTKGEELAGYYCLLAVISGISATVMQCGIGRVSERVSMRLRSEMFESVLRREITFFDQEENAVGNLTTKLSDDSRTIAKASGEAVAKQFQCFFTVVVGLVIAFIASWRISLVVLATFPATIIASAVQMQAVSGQQYGKTEDGANHGAIISSAFTHMRTVAAFSMQFKVANDYLKLTKVIAEDRSNKSRITGAGFGGAQMCMFLTYALLFWYGSTLIEKNEVTFEEMMTAILGLMLGAVGLGDALNDMGDKKLGIQAARRVFMSVEDAKSASIDGLSVSGDRPVDGIKGRIELRNINFHYPTRPDVNVCKNYNLTIEAGEVVALVGPSGSGKSTIMNLLLRFYDPISGDIFLDGHDIKSLNVRWLRSQIGYVGQEPTLFTGTVGQNIAKGRRNFGDCELLTLEQAVAVAVAQEASQESTNSCCSAASVYNRVSNDIEMGHATADMVAGKQNSETDADIVYASRASNAHDFITTFPQGYDTDVGESSIMVSGGQKQRIAIARALIKKPAILLLDEATSALDASSERLVQQSIDELQQSKAQTTIVIAHRLSTIRNADKIAVIDAGEVVEMGTHDQLLANQGLYYTLWNKQKGISGAHSTANLLK